MQPRHIPTLPSHLPQQFTSFVGREAELAELGQRLLAPACRLLTLVGPGGIGKTRLALQALALFGDHFDAGTVFVNLQPVQAEAFLLSAIADALDIPLSAQTPPLQLITNHLSDKRILLLLDNFEQLLGAAPVLSALLAGSRATFLVTSRETLNLQEEWLFPMKGLSYPANDRPVADLAAFGAVRLFAERAQRIRPDFDLAAEGAAVTRICQLVEGMPLALELAAAWANSLRPAEIAAEIERGRDILATRFRNVPARHRSLQAVFAQTWDGLDDAEQAVFRQLAVFRDGFLRAAAAAVAGATLPLLSSFLDKSLLRWEATGEARGRYQIHELLRQYAAEQLLAQPDAAADTRARHARYYAAFVDERLDALLGGAQVAAMTEIEAELNNVRAAWQWAVEQSALDLLLALSMPLVSFYWFQSRFYEARDAFTAGVACLEAAPAGAERDFALATMLTNQGWFLLAAEDHREALRVAERSLALHERLAAAPIRGLDSDPRLIIALIFGLSDRRPESIDLLHAALREAITRPNPTNEQCAQRLLAQMYHLMGDLDAAEVHGRRACELAEAQGDRWGAAYNYDTMGRIALSRGDYEKAERHLQAGYQMQHELRFAQGLADMCVQLADLALRQGQVERARHYAGEGLSLYRESKTLYGEVTMLTRLAHAAVLAGEPAAAREHLRLAVQKGQGHEADFPDILLYITVVAADLLLPWGQDGPLADWLATLVAAPPAHLRHIHRRYAADVAARRLSDRPAGEPDESLTVTALLAVIAALLAAPIDPAASAALPPAVAANEALPEPLTERELEVLALIADGMSNQAIADALIIAVGTVKYYTSHIYGKLGVTSRTQAVAQARELGLLH